MGKINSTQAKPGTHSIVINYAYSVSEQETRNELFKIKLKRIPNGCIKTESQREYLVVIPYGILVGNPKIQSYFSI